MRILLAEDNDANRLIARSILERDGHSVVSTVDGKSALKACTTAHYDAVLLDIMMPGMDGLKTLRRIKALKNANSKVPIFALTAFCSPADQTRYRMAGFNGILPKPLRSGQFDRLVLLYSAGDVPPPAILPAKLVTAFDESPLLDDRVIAQLNSIEDKVALKTVEQRFWDGVKASLETIEQDRHLVLQGDISAITRFRGAVHAIKGSTATIGLARASHIAKSLQNAPPGDTPKLLQLLCACLAGSRTPLQDALHAPPELLIGSR
ncbi:response regulator [Litorimonas sp. RW-G-Af-16]|uniref:response regulator n=1 Tax=Litorimonas sp. RW-G-Af-16 TaxID=3241168 RepID=UPI00390C9AA2